MALHEGDLEHYPRKFGKYHLLGPLAQGGMGALYLAVAGDRGLERLMVIKTVLPHLADAEYVARFRDEAKVVVKLSHGNLIPVFDAGLVGGELFLAMDFVEGRDLRAVWNRCAKKQVAFPIDVAVYIAKELCRGLGYAHSFPDLNLVHRDVSPPNVLVSYTGEVKLTDFGLASSTLKLEKTAPGIIYGKVAYMSPEQARGEKLDGRSDMYAAAIVLWELLTGRQLFPPGKDQPQDLLSRAKNPEVMRPSKRAPRVPVELDEICVRALASKREDRYKDCDEMRMALQSWLAQNAPTTDGTRMSTFLQELFLDDIDRERKERQDLLARVRTRALTLPPTDELRQMIESSGGIAVSDLSGEPPVRKPGSIGRRATDRGDEREDRRKADDRRNFPAGSAADASGAAAALARAPENDELEPELIGATVDGRYHIMELIGEGGMGKVYLAEHVEIGKRVALKVLHPSYSRMPDLVERFRREARAASKIGHPNIVDVTDSGTTNDGSVYFVMEFLEGVELGSVIEREGSMDVARALRISSQICRALAAAHAQGIVHRDLKPENVFLITRDGAADVVKVLDFGIAKTTEAEAARERRLTSPGMAMGTPEYMAPEQAAGRPADARCDVYALGAIMYEMTTGTPPYSGDNFMEILTKKATQDPPPPISVRPELAPQVSDLVMAAMARNPDDRPQTMETLEYELNKCLSGRGVAVAQILGMTTDPNVVERLNQGLSMRHLDDDSIIPRKATSSPAIGLPRASTLGGMAEMQGMWSGPAMSTGQNARHAHGDRVGSEPGASGRSSGSMRAMTPSPARAPSMNEVGSDSMTTSQPIVAKRSGLAILGWLVLGAILFGGVGALVFAALGERGNRAKADDDVTKVRTTEPETGSAEEPRPALGSAGGTGGSAALVAPRNGSGDGSAVGTGSGSAAGNGSADGSAAGSGSAAPEVTEPPGDAKPAVVDAKKDPKKDPKKDSKKDPKKDGKKTVAAIDDKNPKELIKQGKALESAGEWEQARGVYAKLEKIKGYAGQAVYMQAWAAFSGNATGDAVKLAGRAATMPGGYKDQAKFLYGDALYRQGEYVRAKSIYVGLHKQLAGDKKAEAQRKVAACNRHLKLPESDGLL